MRFHWRTALFACVLTVPTNLAQKPSPTTDEAIHLNQERMHDLEMEQGQQNQQIYTNTQHLSDLERRIEYIDGEKLDNRLTRIETEENILMLLITALVLDGAYRIAKRFNGKKSGP